MESPMRRRHFMSLLGGTAFSTGLFKPVTVQAARKLPHVNFVAVGFGADTSAFDAIRDELRRLGEVEGRTFSIGLWASDDLSRAPELAREIVQSSPDVILSINTRIVPALQSLTQRIPIVVAFTGDPVALGFTTSRTRPSGNVTGVEDFQDALIGKRFELVKALIPTTKRIGILCERGNVGHALVLQSARDAAPSLSLELLALDVQSTNDIGRLLDRLPGTPIDALIVVSSPLILSQERAIIQAELALKLPAIHDLTFEVHDGALAAYGSDPGLNFERAAQYVDRLLHGARVADLPFDQPTYIKLAFNLNTARTLALTIPPSLLARADEVIE